MVPKTEVWDKWKMQIKDDALKDPKKLYRGIPNDIKD
jgi:hypothetical protein